jgi:hypothetical protein
VALASAAMMDSDQADNLAHLNDSWLIQQSKWKSGLLDRGRGYLGVLTHGKNSYFRLEQDQTWQLENGTHRPPATLANR